MDGEESMQADPTQPTVALQADPAPPPLPTRTLSAPQRPLLREQPTQRPSSFPSASEARIIARTQDREALAPLRLPLPILRHSSSSQQNGRSSFLPSLSFSLSSFGSVLSSTVKTFYCQICLENMPVDAGFVLTNCQHCFCRDCLNDYLCSKIVDAQIYIPCPFVRDDAEGGHDTGCTTEIAEDDIRSIVNSSISEKLERFKLRHEDETLRECPSCSTDVAGGSARRPQLVCPKCNLAFCFTHSNAHPGQTCRQYERARRAEERRAQAAIAEISRKCPGCRTPIMRNGGCNHMTCSNCRADFCWLCGRDLGSGGTNVSNHYAPWNICGCPGLQMQEGCCSKQPRWCALLAMLVFRLCFFPAVLIFFSVGWVLGLAAAAVWIVIIYPLMCLCCCLSCIRDGVDWDDYEDGDGYPYACYPCWFTCLPCYFGRQILSEFE